MEAPGFRERVLEAAYRVEARTGIDPLDLRRSMAITTDARLELLPRSIGIGLGAMAAAVAIVSVGLLVAPSGGPGYLVTAVLVILDVLLLAGLGACLVLARDARSRRPANDRYEDAWARLAVELWPAPRYRVWDGPGVAAYSRTEFLIAVREGAALDRFRRRAPFTRMP